MKPGNRVSRTTRFGGAAVAAGLAMLAGPAAAQADKYVDEDTGSGVACTLGARCATVQAGVTAAAGLSAGVPLRQG